MPGRIPALQPILPQIPTMGGVTARLGTDVLVSAFEECNLDTVRLQGKVPPCSMGDFWQDVQSVRQIAARALHADEITTSATACKTLFQHDHLHMFSRSVAVRDFDGHDNHDEGLNDAATDERVMQETAKAMEEAMARPKALPPLPGSSNGARKNKLKAQQKTIARKSLRNLMSLRTTMAPQPGLRSRTRLSFLQSSFARTLEETRKRYLNVELNLGEDAALVLHNLQVSSSSLEAYPDADHVAQTYDKVQLDTMQIRPPALMPFLAEKEQGCIPMLAGKKEILLCAAQLNLYRWLCGLPPARISKPCEVMCELLADILLPRSQPASVAAGNQIRLAEAVNAYFAGDGITDGPRVIVVHGEGSLLTAVEQSLFGSHELRRTQQEEALSAVESKSRPNRSTLARELVEKVNEYTAKHGSAVNSKRQQLNKPIEKPNTLQITLPKHVPTLTEIPARLRPMEILWELQPQGSPRRLTTVHQDRRMALKVNKPVVRALPEIRSRFRKEAMFDPEHHHNSPIAKNSSFWGDLEGSLVFRRCLLNPALKEFGAARHQDNCVLWSGHLGRHEPTGADAQRASFSSVAGKEHRKELHHSPRSTSHVDRQRMDDYDMVDAVCFPPSGFVPLELVRDMNMLWTIMPHSARYQPTENVRIRVFRATIDTPEDDEWTAVRHAEIPVSSFKIDCSSHGNPFCIIFRPEVAQIRDGDQFEVVLSGLCGEHYELTFFHQFCALKQHILDELLLQEVESLRKTLAVPSLWQNVTACIPAQQNVSVDRNSISSGNKPGSRPKTHTSRGRRPQVAQDVVQTSHGPISMTQIGLVSHPSLEIHTESVNVTIALRSENLEALWPALYLARVSGNEEVPHASQVFRVSDQFIVRVKLPMASAKYELHFLVSPKTAPETVIPHPLKYTIVTSDACQNLLASLQHPLSQKFGYAALLPTAQLNRIAVISPASYRLSAGQVYFLFHVANATNEDFNDETPGDQQSLQSTGQSITDGYRTNASFGSDGAQAQRSTKSCNSKQATNSASSSLPRPFEATAPSCPTRNCSLFSNRLRRFENKGRSSTRLETHNWAADLHDTMRGAMEPLCQDTFDDVHMDVFIGGKYVLRLAQRRDFPELYEALIVLEEVDATGRVEVFLRKPRREDGEYAPQKLGEWLISCHESLPPGF